MAQEQPERPLTYGDVFDVKGEMASEPITKEDASLMQSVEAIGAGQNLKGGAAAVMQSAALHNVKTGLVDPDAHSNVAEQGLRFSETIVNGHVQDTEFVGNQPVATKTSYVPTLPEAAAMQGVTIGEALEEVAMFPGKKVVDSSDARAIQSAEARATGMPLPIKGGVGSLAQSAVHRNEQGESITLGEVLQDATDRMVVDKVVTQEDAEKVKQAENREGGKDDLPIASAIQAAADLNADADRYIEAQERLIAGNTSSDDGSDTAPTAASMGGPPTIDDITNQPPPSQHPHQE